MLAMFAHCIRLSDQACAGGLAPHSMACLYAGLPHSMPYMLYTVHPLSWPDSVPYDASQASQECLQDMDERLCIDMAKVGEAIKHSQVLTIHGKDDATIPYTDAKEFHKHIREHKLHLIEGANHNFSQPEHAQELIQTAIAFITGD